MVPAPDPSTGSDADGSASSPSRRRSGTAFSRHVGRVTERFDELLPFALVPLATSLVPFERLRRALDSAGGFSLNLEFRLPSPLHDLWSFADVPAPPTPGSTGPLAPGSNDGVAFGDPPSAASGTDGVGDVPGAGTSTDVTIETPLETVAVPVDTVGIETLGWIGFTLLLYAVLSAALAAGYIGGIDRRLREEPAAIRQCLSSYTLPLLYYYLVVFGAFLAFVPFALVAPWLLLLAIPLVLVLGYAFYATPFLLVVADIGVLEALRRSSEYALEGGAYLSFALWHVLATAVVSGVLSALASAGGGAALLALGIAVPFSLVLTAATVSFCQELVGTESTDSRGAADRPESGPDPRRS